MSPKKIPRNKSKFSKKSKKAWRITDIKDIEVFYEDQLLEERLGGPFSEKPDEELFFIQKDPLNESTERKKRKLSHAEIISEKKKRAFEPPKCFSSLENSSMVPDPISKRNRTRTKEERKSHIQKDIEEKLRQKGILKKKEIIAAKNRLLNKKRAKIKPKPFYFNKDMWKDENKDVENTEWLDEHAVRHYETNTGQFVVKTPKSVQKKPTVIPNIEKPHPGISYNPSKEDHNQLLQIVAEKEMKMIKEEEHLDRVTSKFRKISRQEAMDNWMAEMSQGIIKNENDKEEDEDLGEYKPINPPALLKIKPLRKKKKAKLLRAEELERKNALIEKKKLADLYKLKFMEREILEKEEKSNKLQEKKKVLKAEDCKRTKKLGPVKFSEPLPEFQRPNELRKNLRTMKAEGSILTDRFYSLQKRNLIKPTLRVRNKKVKVKRFFKPGHKVEESDVDKAVDAVLRK